MYGKYYILVKNLVSFVFLLVIEGGRGNLRVIYLGSRKFKVFFFDKRKCLIIEDKSKL